MSATDVLEGVPDLTDWNVAESWVHQRLEQFDVAPRIASGARLIPVQGEVGEQSAVGAFNSRKWRQLVLCAFVADWACYPEPVDRVDFSRLIYVMSTFPQGFRIWFSQTETDGFLPVGYTGWYPISQGIVAALLREPESVTHRGFFAPQPLLTAESYIYLYNASIIPAFRRGTPQSSAMMQKYAEDIGAAGPHGLVSITVSEDGARFSRRFGMTHAGTITVDGSPEQIFVKTDP